MVALVGLGKALLVDPWDLKIREGLEWLPVFHSILQSHHDLVLQPRSYTQNVSEKDS
jgi:hypothetical protein